MTVSSLFELFMLRKITALILLVLFNIAAFFSYDFVAKNYQIQLKMQFPITEEGAEIVNHSYYYNKYSTPSVRAEVLSGVDKASYKFLKLADGSKFIDLSVNCEIKENCITASKLLIDALNNEAKVNNEGTAYAKSNKIYEMQLLNFNNSINSLKNAREMILNSEIDFFQISEANVDEANNLNNFSEALLLQNINNERQKAVIELAKINTEISEKELALKVYTTLNKPKHLFMWIVEPSHGDISRKVSFSLWLTLSFLLSISLYFLAAVMINTKQN